MNSRVFSHVIMMVVGEVFNNIRWSSKMKSLRYLEVRSVRVQKPTSASYLGRWASPTTATWSRFPKTTSTRSTTPDLYRNPAPLNNILRLCMCGYPPRVTLSLPYFVRHHHHRPGGERKVEFQFVVKVHLAILIYHSHCLWSPYNF